MYLFVLFDFQQKSNINTESADHKTELVKSEKNIDADNLEVLNNSNENSINTSDNVSINFGFQVTKNLETK